MNITLLPLLPRILPPFLFLSLSFSSFFLLYSDQKNRPAIKATAGAVPPDLRGGEVLLQAGVAAPEAHFQAEEDDSEAEAPQEAGDKNPKSIP